MVVLNILTSPWRASIIYGGKCALVCSCAHQRVRVLTRPLTTPDPDSDHDPNPDSYSDLGNGLELYSGAACDSAVLLIMALLGVGVHFFFDVRTSR